MKRRRWGVVVTMLALVATPAVPAQTASKMKARLDAIAAAQSEARQQFSEALEGKTTEAAQRPAIDRFLSETARNTAAVLDLVRANPDDPAAVEALAFVIRTARAGPGDESYQAMEILLRDHVCDPGMGEVAGGVFYIVHAPVAERLLRAVVERHPNRDDRGHACHALADYLRLKARMIRRIREQPARIDHYVHERHKAETERLVKEADPDALEAEAESLFGRVVAEFGDVKVRHATRTLGAIAAGQQFAMRNLAVGKVAPEITGMDHEGKPFALSSQRGKVVVLTFSGNWCGPCVGMYPQERALVAKLKDKPFALVSVNTDAKVETLTKSIDSGEITWRCWWDGGTEGPITTRWGVSAFPSIFVLDRSGVIRYKDVRDTDLEKAVATLLDETPETGTSKL